MLQERLNNKGERYVIGPTGEPLTLEEACERYRLTPEEFLGWQSSIDRHGMAGLRTTRIQVYR